MLYFQPQYGVPADLSADVLYLLGISAAGAGAGKFTALYKERLSLANWTWLRRKWWLASGEDDRATKALWRDLVSHGKEFDVAKFQMAIFSLVVAAALLTTSFSGLASFEIPDEVLALLDISQRIYVAGKVIEPSARRELDDHLT